MLQPHNKFQAVYELVCQIPAGQVASYGMIEKLLKGVTARMVGYAMAATPAGEGIPWQRVINSQGKISERDGAERQRAKLEAEGIVFSKSGKVNWANCRWQGPSEAWLDANKIEFMDYLEIQSRWPA